MAGLHIPFDQEILTTCNNGESQLYEFKRGGVEMKVLAKECCAFANTKLGGLIFYGIEDDVQLQVQIKNYKNWINLYRIAYGIQYLRP